MYLLTSACSWFTVATSRSSTIATASIVSADCAALAGRRCRRIPGSGRVPRTESTTIFKGTGFSKAMGLASSPMPKSRARWVQYGRAGRHSRRYRARSPISRGLVRGCHCRADRSHGGHALFDDVDGGEQGADAQQPSRGPELRVGGDRGEPCECESEDGPAHGHLGPPANAHELLPAGVVLDAHDESRHAEDPAAHFEVPVVELFAAQHAGAFRAEPLFERAQPPFLCLPALAPDRCRDGPERRPSPRGASAPRCESLLEAPAQTREGLSKVQRGRQQPARQPGES